MGSRENPRSSGYPVEFKQAAIELYLTSEHRSLARTAKELGISPTTLKNWVRQAKVDHGQAPGVTSDERTELARLRQENRRLKQERDLLKRAAAFFAQESETR
jgi:transposase